MFQRWRCLTIIDWKFRESRYVTTATLRPILAINRDISGIPQKALSCLILQDPRPTGIQSFDKRSTVSNKESQ